MHMCHIVCVQVPVPVLVCKQTCKIKLITSVSYMKWVTIIIFFRSNRRDDQSFPKLINMHRCGVVEGTCVNAPFVENIQCCELIKAHCKHHLPHFWVHVWSRSGSRKGKSVLSNTLQSLKMSDGMATLVYRHVRVIRMHPHRVGWRKSMYSRPFSYAQCCHPR